jgi:hypothetical protein
VIHCPSDPEAYEIFAWCFQRYAENAARQSLIGAGEVESSDPSELVAFARYRFDDLLDRFTMSFFEQRQSAGFSAGCSARQAAAAVTAPARQALLAFVAALGCRGAAFRRDECGDWRINGQYGWIYAVAGTLDRPGAEGFLLYYSGPEYIGSARGWGIARRAFEAFGCVTTQDGDDEGIVFLGFGQAKDLIMGILAASGVPMTWLTPPQWKRLVGIAPGKAGAKDAARSEACRIWPGKAALFARAKDDGRAEACLIAAAGLEGARLGHSRPSDGRPIDVSQKAGLPAPKNDGKPPAGSTQGVRP